MILRSYFIFNVKLFIKNLNDLRDENENELIKSEKLEISKDFCRLIMKVLTVLNLMNVLVIYIRISVKWTVATTKQANFSNHLQKKTLELLPNVLGF